VLAFASHCTDAEICCENINRKKRRYLRNTYTAVKVCMLKYVDFDIQRTVHRDIFSDIERTVHRDILSDIERTVHRDILSDIERTVHRDILSDIERTVHRDIFL
jgi:hypothetical protein